jgi:chemotaxis signal transduction protein
MRDPLEARADDPLRAFPLAAGLLRGDFEAALDGRARRLARVEAQEDAIAGRDEAVLTFSCGGEAFALPLAHVREIRRAAAPIPLPGLPPFLAGVVSRRGRVLAIADLARYLELGRDEERRRLLLLHGSGYDLYFFAGADLGVSYLDGAPRPPSSSWSERRRRVSRGIYAGLVTLLDPDRLLAEIAADGAGK